MSVIKAAPQVATDGAGEVSEVKRPLKQGEFAEWILLDAVCAGSNLTSAVPKPPQTPATCANIALHNLFPGQFDLVISGPNYGMHISWISGNLI